MRLGKCKECGTEKYANEIFQDHILKTQCKNGHIADRPRHPEKS